MSTLSVDDDFGWDDCTDTRTVLETVADVEDVEDDDGGMFRTPRPRAIVDDGAPGRRPGREETEWTEDDRTDAVSTASGRF